MFNVLSVVLLVIILEYTPIYEKVYGKNSLLFYAASSPTRLMFATLSD